ncbi:MAG: hypothetical protein Q8N26_18510 [Myxococcales bacterium]|nr:hypothetical protein [Myxococcales bacterium]
MLSTLLALTLTAGSFPLPTIDGKPLAATAEQKSFRLPMRFEKVRGFYDAQFIGDAKGITAKVSGTTGKRVLTLISSRAGDTWKKAIVREGEVETVIDVTPVLRMAEEQIEGNGRPLVQFIIGRSGDVDRAVDAIGRKHVEQIRQ